MCTCSQRHSFNTKFFFLFSSLLLNALLMSATDDASEIKIPLPVYLQTLNAGKPLKDGSNVAINLPVLEIFDSQGVPVYYSDSSRIAIPDLQHMHGRISSLRPISAHVSLDTFLRYLRDSGAKTEKAVAKDSTYTFLFIRSDRPHSEPEIKEQEALQRFLRAESNQKIGVVNLVVSGIN